MPYIYKIINSVNNKVYIGQTIKNPKERLREHIYIATHPKFDCKSKLHSAMRKYGCDRFDILTIEECKKESLDEREKYWIQQYDSMNNGYNCTLGGEGAKLFDSAKFIELWGKGLTISEISRETLTDRATVSEDLYACGIKSEDILQRTSEFMFKAMNMPVYQYDLEGNFVNEYSSIKEASDSTGVNINCIKGVLAKQHYTAGNFQWKRFKADKIEKSSRIVNSTKKEVHQYTLSGEYVKSYKSLNSARIGVGLSSASTIRRVISGEAKQTAGYKWSYKKVQHLSEINNKEG